MQVGQLSLLDRVQPAERPWKRTTTTSKAAARAFEASGQADRRRAICLRGLRAIWNWTQAWPTADELAIYLFNRKLIPSSHRDEVAPRLNELADGVWIARVVDGRRIREQVGGGLIERGEKRESYRSGKRVLTWRVREAGSAPLPQSGL